MRAKRSLHSEVSLRFTSLCSERFAQRGSTEKRLPESNSRQRSTLLLLTDQPDELTVLIRHTSGSYLNRKILFVPLFLTDCDELVTKLGRR